MAIALIVLAFVLSGAPAAQARFAILLPSDDIVTFEDDKTIKVQAWFVKPFEQMILTLDKPRSVGVYAGGKKTDLMDKLSKMPIEDGEAYELEYKIRRPGALIFFMEMDPYWIAGEEKYLVQFTKTVVSALGKSGGWDAELGLTAEVVPVTRPYGIWAGNIFQGRVLYKGEPQAGALVQVEYYNEGGSVKAPAPPYISQTVRTDENGVFTYAIPREGWWGFSATFNSGEVKLLREVHRRIYHSAVIWVRAREMK
jgi:cobalt/nickel transport protein